MKGEVFAMWMFFDAVFRDVVCRRVRARVRDDRGQATAEYALVLLAAATLALLLIAWAAQSGKIGTLFDAVFDHVIDQVA